MHNNSNSQIYDSLRKFIGYGNPNGKYWFIGMEENWKNINDKNDIFTNFDFDYYRNPIAPIRFDDFEKRIEIKNSFESGIFKILKRFANNIEIAKDAEFYLNDIFVTNIRFFPAYANKKHLKILLNKFDLNITIEQYENDEFKRREQIKKLLYDRRVTNNLIFTFCLSKSYRNLYVKLFEIINEKDEKININNNEKLYLFPHPSSRGLLFDNRLNEII